MGIYIAAPALDSLSLCTGTDRACTFVQTGGSPARFRQNWESSPSNWSFSLIPQSGQLQPVLSSINWPTIPFRPPTIYGIVRAASHVQHDHDDRETATTHSVVGNHQPLSDQTRRLESVHVWAASPSVSWKRPWVSSETCRSIRYCRPGAPPGQHKDSGYIHKDVPASARSTGMMRRLRAI